MKIAQNDSYFQNADNAAKIESNGNTSRIDESNLECSHKYVENGDCSTHMANSSSQQAVQEMKQEFRVPDVSLQANSGIHIPLTEEGMCHVEPCSTRSFGVFKADVEGRDAGCYCEDRNVCSFCSGLATENWVREDTLPCNPGTSTSCIDESSSGIDSRATMCSSVFVPGLDRGWSFAKGPDDQGPDHDGGDTKHKLEMVSSEMGSTGGCSRNVIGQLYPDHQSGIVPSVADSNMGCCAAASSVVADLTWVVR